MSIDLQVFHRAIRALLRRGVAGAVLGLLISASGRASAQFAGQRGDAQQHLVRIGVSGGMLVPTSGARTALEQGMTAEGFVLVNLGGFPLRFDLGYQHFGLKPASSGPSSTNESGIGQILGGIAGTQIDLLHGPVRPYLTAGIGGFDLMKAMQTASGSMTASGLNIGVDGGGGLAIKLGRLSAFGEARLQNVYSQGKVLNLKTVQSVPVSFGVMF